MKTLVHFQFSLIVSYCKKEQFQVGKFHVVVCVLFSQSLPFYTFLASNRTAVRDHVILLGFQKPFRSMWCIRQIWFNPSSNPINVFWRRWYRIMFEKQLAARIRKILILNTQNCLLNYYLKNYITIHELHKLWILWSIVKKRSLAIAFVPLKENGLG